MPHLSLTGNDSDPTVGIRDSASFIRISRPYTLISCPASFRYAGAGKRIDVKEDAVQVMVRKPEQTVDPDLMRRTVRRQSDGCPASLI